MKTLPVPFFRQQAPTYCALAALQMILSYKNPTVQQNKVTSLVWGAVQRAKQELEVTVDPNVGVAPARMGDLMALLGISAFQYTFPNAGLAFDNIKKFIDGNSPILVYLQQGLQGAYGHFLVIVGYGTDAQAADRAYIQLHDPSGEASKAVYYDLFPGQYFVQGSWLWGESWVVS
jgi:hypothetical protein